MPDIDPRLAQGEGTNIYNGNELLVKGALEAGVSLYASYPGSPVAETLDVIRGNAALFREHGIEAVVANNEALAAARINGSQALPLRAAAIMKSVGFNVALDVFEVANLAGANPGGGAVAMIGDDPHCSSTQVPADSRYKSRSIHMPVLMPSTWQEIKDWVDTAFELSASTGFYITYLITTAQADGGGTVSLRPNRRPGINSARPVNLDTSGIDTYSRVMIPPASGKAEVRLLEERLPRVYGEIRRLGFNRTVNWSAGQRYPLGFVTAGPSWLYLSDALAELGLGADVPVLKLGAVWPLDNELVLEFARSVDSLVVVEEKGPFIEDQVKVLLHDSIQEGLIGREECPAVCGKKFRDGSPCLPASRGLSPSELIRILGPLLTEAFPGSATRISAEAALIEEVSRYEVFSPTRPATFCAGCPHRDTGNLLMDMIADSAGGADTGGGRSMEPEDDLVVHGDIGCYSMFNGIWESRLMHDMSAMGQGLGAAAGLEPFVVNKRAVMIGDSTFFHTGLAGISDLAKHDHDVLVLVLDNETTAMTGQHPTPHYETDLIGRSGRPQDIEQAIRGIVGPDVPVKTVDPNDERSYRRVAEDLLNRKGLKVIISRKPCAIKEGRELKGRLAEVVHRRGFLPAERRINITEEVCEDCLECTRKTGCLGLERTETRLGKKVRIDPNMCVSDGACYRVEACPSFEEITIRRSQEPPSRTLEADIGQLPEPDPVTVENRWRSYICGFGGQGSNTVTAILARAGMYEGYGVTLHNRKGMAIRNGAVKSVLVFSSPDEATGPLVPEGKCDLVVGLDILEVARALDAGHHISIGSPAHTRVVVSSAKNQTLETIQGTSDFEPDELAAQIEHHTRPGGLIYEDVRSVAERYCGHSRYLNTVLLGLAWQKGWIPVGRDNLLRALDETVPGSQREVNRLAFTLGRQLAVDRPALFPPEPEPTLDEELEKIERWIRKDPGGRRLAPAFRDLFSGARRGLSIPESELRGLAYRLEDVLQYGGPEEAERYLGLILRAHEADSGQEGRRATVALIHNLHRVMVVKDEVHVSHLLTCARKLERDREQYNVDPARGDRIRYRHFTTPQFNLLGRELRVKITTRQWMLRLMRRMRFLRRIMPGWHTREREFAGWYIANVVEPFISRQGRRPSYRAFVEAINAPELARGYREVRAPGMEAARRGVMLLLGRGEELSLERDGAGDRRLPFRWRNPGKPGLQLGSRGVSKEPALEDK